MKNKTVSRLSQIGVYGFDKVEPVILAALVTEDPLLLIGETGTGKTYLLNSLSEVLGLEHRHYNASLISFDDLVGFPYPDATNEGVKFLETPATVWGAESVLIDEISRCKPEHQNRLFSLIHERRLQGIALDRLRYRWAAMNPCSADQTSYEDYSGSEPLDPALADRFALFVKAVDWENLSDVEKTKVADPKGEGAVSNDGGCLKNEVQEWRGKFNHQIQACPQDILTYVKTVVTLFNAAKIRVSPRRARLLSRSLLAAVIITGKVDSNLFLQFLICSLPQVTWGEEVKQEKIAAIHKTAWKTLNENPENAWVLKFKITESLAEKLNLLIDGCTNPDVGTQAIEQLISSLPIERAAAFAYATFPAASHNKLPIGAEAIHDLGKIAMPIFLVDGKLTWQERLSQSDSMHPEFVRYAKAMKGLFGPRKQSQAVLQFLPSERRERGRTRVAGTGDQPMYQNYQRIEVIQTRCLDPRTCTREYLFNMGGPMSRTRTETIHESILANPQRPIKCPLVISLGLDFKDQPPVIAMGALLKAEGFSSPEELRKEYLTLSSTCVCHVSFSPARLPAAGSAPELVLKQAVILGLCTATYFNPGRPILWTSTSLTRCLDLYNMEDFYL